MQTTEVEELNRKMPSLEDVHDIFRKYERTIADSVLAIESVPRLGFTGHGSCLLSMTYRLGIKSEWHQGAFWSQVLTRAIESAIARGLSERVDVGSWCRWNW